MAFDQPTNLPQNTFDNVVMGFFWLDLLLNFFQEYRDPDTYKDVRELKLIARNYVLRQVSTWLIL